MNIHTDGMLRGIAILERPCPIVHNQLIEHGHRNRSTQRWKETFRLARDMGFRYIRAGIPWNRVWLDENCFDWSQIDAEFDYAEELGITLIPMLAHMSYDWESGFMKGPNGEHALERADLHKHFAHYTRLFLERYQKHLSAGFIPIVEVGGEGLNRFILERWEPHRKDDFAAQERALFNLVKVFNKSAQVGREFDIPVVACEAICLNEPKFTLAALQLDFDVLGVNFYAFANKGRSLTEALTQWREMFIQTRGIDPIFALFEWGSPEYMDVDNWWFEEPGYHNPTSEQPYPEPCRDINRKKEDELLSKWLGEIKPTSIKLSFVCRFLVSNFWHYWLTQPSEGMECDRNGLIDVTWNHLKGDYDYRPCFGIARRLHEIIEQYNKS